VRNSGARAGDVLVLTKPIGTGVIATAIKRGIGRGRRSAAVASMTTLNRGAAEAMLRVGVSAATDVTGFGLLGHLRNMLRASGVSRRDHAAAVPLLPGVAELAAAGCIPGGTRRNLEDLAGRRRLGRRPHRAAAAHPVRRADVRRPAHRRAGGAREDARRRADMWITRPSEASAASAIASDSVGCGCIAFSISSTVLSRCRPTMNSAISSLALGPTMCAPTISLYLRSRMILTKPSVSPAVRARPFALHGNEPTSTSSPFSFAAFSVRPTLATSGMAVRHVRDVVVVDHAVTDAGDVLDHGDALVRRLVRQQRRLRAVADGVHVLRRRLQVVVHDDEAAVRLHARLVEADVLDDRRAADGDEHDVDARSLRLAVLRLHVQRHAVLADVRLLQPRATCMSMPRFLYDFSTTAAHSASSSGSTCSSASITVTFEPNAL
jgi:hypothetical protein